MSFSENLHIGPRMALGYFIVKLKSSDSLNTEPLDATDAIASSKYGKRKSSYYEEFCDPLMYIISYVYWIDGLKHWETAEHLNYWILEKIKLVVINIKYFCLHK